MTSQLTNMAVLPDGAAQITWSVELQAQGLRTAVDVVSGDVATALEAHTRVEALLPVDDEDGQRIATWSGLRREGVRRDVTGDCVVYARLVTDPPVSDPEGFRSMLNSFLPRKRAIGQMLVRDRANRVLMCQLTYKRDWDLPGGVVEVNESPRLATTRELEEELGVTFPAGDLVLTDWLPPWSGWDDAVTLVFDGGVHDSAVTDSMVLEEREIRSATFCTIDEVRDRATDFTARRVEAALARLGGTGAPYTESGRP
ncbi:MAG: NUDIX hydrolase [Nocardioides sp.]|nr:NUDIX hydrolase [Nocardioides sp.]